MIGIWETEDRDSDAIFEITNVGNKLKVVAFNKRDGERFKVSKLRTTSNGIKFETFVPSTKYRAKHFLRCVSKSAILQELTLIERWIRVTDSPTFKRSENR
jgi:hypothetical protein